MDVVCVGDVMLDIRVDADALKRGGDVHGRVRLQPGGTSANSAVWAAWDGASSRVHGRIGDDLQGRMMRTSLAERGVEDALVVDPEEPTGTMLVVHEPGERSMAADRGANANLVPGDLPDALEAGAVLISGYLLLLEAGQDAALAALERARAPLVAVEAASWPLVEAFGVGRFFEATAGATVVLANELEARTLTGTDGEEAAAALGERYRVAAVKLGAEGAVLAVDGALHHAPAEPVEELDTTGAGDAFDGVLLASLARGADPPMALRRACHAGALVAASASAWPERTGEEPRG
ncbi:MAG: PfkB family carbohydrate kinase [Actinomycetota bacterium]